MRDFLPIPGYHDWLVTQYSTWNKRTVSVEITQRINEHIFQSWDKRETMTCINTEQNMYREYAMEDDTEDDNENFMKTWILLLYNFKLEVSQTNFLKAANKFGHNLLGCSKPKISLCYSLKESYGRKRKIGINGGGKKS